jgi:hypothetical protein
MTEIKDRALSGLSFSGLDAFTFPDGQNAVGATCHITLVAIDGSPEGPGANVFVAIPAAPDLTLRETERAVLARVHDVLGRLASFSVEELERSFDRKKEADKATGFPGFHESRK